MLLPDIGDLQPFISVCRKQWEIHHELKDTDDRVAEPKDTGYRSIHLIYRFKDSDKSFDGRLVEVQFRSHLQHIWATFVEIADLFLGNSPEQSLKAGKGDPQWQRFFLLLSAVIAKMERTTEVPNTPKGRLDESDLLSELRHYEQLLKVGAQVRTWGSFERSIGKSYRSISGYSGDTDRPGYFVMELDIKSKKTDLRGYRDDQVSEAYQDVAKAEQSNPNVVLVTAANLERLNEAYPNWTFDTRNFLMLLHLTLE